MDDFDKSILALLSVACFMLFMAYLGIAELGKNSREYRNKIGICNEHGYPRYKNGYCIKTENCTDIMIDINTFK